MNTIKDRISILKEDITKMEVDAIVNAANSSLMGGGGVDGAIHRAGGSAILEECQKIVVKQGPCKTGDAVITTGGNLPAKHVIHTVGPVWHGGNNNEDQLLGSCYRNSLRLAVDNQCKMVAFPCISTGVYGYPKEKAAAIAVEAVAKFLRKTDKIEKVIFVPFDDENYSLLQNELSKI